MCRLIDPSVISVRLRLAIESLFQLGNQTFYLGSIHRSSEPLIFQMRNRLHRCIDDLDGILKEIEPKQIDITFLNAEELAIMANYASLKEGMVKSYLWIESREHEILKSALLRVEQGGNQQ